MTDKKKNIAEGGIDGHSEKWAERKRPKSSFNAGQGNSASRNQGLGQQGIDNTKPSDTIDTSKMNPAEKARYFNKLFGDNGIPNMDTPTPKSSIPKYNRPVRRSSLNK